MSGRWVTLLRGINVGGTHLVPMAELRALLGHLGFRDPRTLIQSGNCVFTKDSGSGPEISERIAGAIESEFGFRPAALTLTAERFRTIVEGTPFLNEGEEDPSRLHLFFLVRPAGEVDSEAIDRLKAGSERWFLDADAFHLWAPDGIGRSKLAARVERLLDVPVTARNYRTARRLLALLGS